MHAEVIAIGDELTSGERLDTNSQWLSARLGELGVAVWYHSTVGDGIDPIVRVLREALDRADVIVVTGGLGPTADDLTRQAMAAATGRELISDPAVLEHIRALFERRGRAMPAANVIQACFPDGSRVIPNPHGTAPGIDLSVDRPNEGPARIFALPGVPAEMREMWEQTVAPALIQQQGGQRGVIRHHRIKCFGIGESDLEQMLPDIIRRGREPSVGITVSRATITLRVTARGADAAECQTRMQPTIDTIHDCLGDLVFGAEDDELQHAVQRLMALSGYSLATAECDPGGLLTRWLSEVGELGAGYHGGWVLRSAEAARRHLSGVDEIVQRFGRHSPQFAQLLAEQCRAQFDVDYGLAIGPFAPAAADTDQPARVQIGLASPTGVQTRAYALAGHPDIVESRAVKQALNFLRRQLLDGQGKRANETARE